jgi:hypothetical protein
LNLDAVDYRIAKPPPFPVLAKKSIGTKNWAKPGFEPCNKLSVG